MATNDLIYKLGGKPANFLDLTGSAYHEQIEQMIGLLDWDR